jgi:hypothetical protein
MGFFVEMLCFETWDSVLKYRLKYLIPFKHDESGFVAFAVGAILDTVLLLRDTHRGRSLRRNEWF